MSEWKVVASGWIPNEPPVSQEVVEQLLAERDLQEQMAVVLQRVFGSVGGYIVDAFDVDALKRNPMAYGELLVQWVADHDIRVKRLEAVVGDLTERLRIKEAVIEMLRRKLTDAGQTAQG